MTFNPRENNLPLSRFESMLKTNSVYFFDAIEFEEIIHYYIDSGKNNLAKKAIQLALRQHPNSIIIRLLNAEIIIFDGTYSEAFGLLNELQAIDPTNEEIYIQKASIYSKKDDHMQAIKALKVALVYSEDTADILSMIGMEYLYLDDFDEARLNFAKCLSVDYEDYSSLYNIIYCFDMQGQHEEAISYLNEYIDKDPYSEVAWHQLGRQHYILKQYELALRAFDFAVLIDEYFVGAYLEKAKTLERLGRFEEAIANYRTTTELDDPTAFAFLRIGECYEQTGNTTSACQYYRKAVHEDPLLDKGWMALTDLNMKEGKLRRALFHVNKALEIDQENSLYWRKYAEICLKLNLFEEAVHSFNKCILLKDYDISIWVGLADVLNFLGEYEDAVECLNNAQELFRDFAEIEYRLAGLYYRLKKVDSSMECLKKGLSIDFEYRRIVEELYPEVFENHSIQNIIADFGDTSH
jgi:tetratricopeptide (TPR) repeat protein